MGLINRGYDGYAQQIEQQKQMQEEENKKREQEKKNKVYEFYVKAGDVKEIIFLDDDYARVLMHNIYVKSLNKVLSYVCCKSVNPNDECVLCQGGKYLSELTHLRTVKDMTGYTNDRGEKKGVGAVKLYKLRDKINDSLDNLRQNVALRKASYFWAEHKDAMKKKGCNSLDDVLAGILKAGNVLQNCKVKVVVGKKSTDVTFTLIENVKKESLGQYDVPINYENSLEIKSNDEIVQELSALGVSVNGGKDESQHESIPVQDTNDYAVASNYSAEDIPF